MPASIRTRSLVGIDDIATLSRELDAALDEHDPIAGAYTLEVTSPGRIDR
jgi:ribosome maturation factor RimP